MTKRNLFKDLREGVQALKAERLGKVTLKTTAIGELPEVMVSPQEIVALRERMGVSRAVFARMLRVKQRSLENWEQGRGGGPSGPAATLIRLAEKYPDTFERVAAL